MTTISSRKRKKISAKFLPFALAAALAFPALGTTVDARDSVFTQKGTGPLYWIAYEHCFTKDTYIPEERWKANIDWLDKDFKKYGYNMVSIDGWGDVKSFNANGYRTKHHSSWKYDYAYWAKYLSERGMSLGIYNNPLWVSKFAVDAGCKIEGTDTPLSAIVNTNDMFAGDQYWVNVDHPDAEKYVKGYINYYKKMGVTFLRVDFLSWYEDGKDHGKKVPWGTDIAHGPERYEKALRWMQEACGEDMILSIVMPHLNHGAKVEMETGDMSRINEDCGIGSWTRFSEFNRGIHYGYWSHFSNPFDGLIYWSKYFGRGKMIPDADMLRLNTFSNDEERKTAVSLCAMAGAPINIADQYDTIGKSAWIYQNEELLELNHKGFIGKPFSHDPSTAESQKWKGQLPDGTWVVGLFNRESKPQTRTVNFATDLGITGDASVRDIWEHTDLGNMSTYSVTLEPHACVILKVKGTQGAVPDADKPGGYIVNPGFEAGNTSGWIATGGNAGVDSNDAKSGNKCYFWGSNPFTQKLDQTVTGLPDGTYTVTAWVKQNTGTPKICRMELSDYGGESVYIDIPHGDSYQQISGTVQVTNGQVNIAFFEDAPENCNLQIDSVQIAPAGEAPAPMGTIANPGFEEGSIKGWTAFGNNYSIRKNDAHSGNNKGYFASPDPFRQKLEQTVTGLANGTYEVRAWVKQDSGTPNIARMELKNGGDDPVYVDIPHSDTYQQISGKAQVSNGQLTIAFFADAPGNTNLSIDDVELVAVDVQTAPAAKPGTVLNGGFEAGNTYGWKTSENHYGVDVNDVYNGKYKLYFWGGSDPYKQRIEQTVTDVKNGKYVVSAWVKQNTGNPKAAQMEISGFGGTDVTIPIKHGDKYLQYTAAVEVTNGQITIAFSTESPGNTNLQVDDVEIQSAE